MFTERCHIKKNTKYLRTELNDLGYKCNNGKWMGSYLCTFHPIGASNKNEVCYCGSPEWDLKGNPDLFEQIRNDYQYRREIPESLIEFVKKR